MKRLKQIFLKPGAYRVGERMLTYTAEDLRTIAANTKKLLASGIAVPLWAAHKIAGSPEGGPQQFSNAPATDNKGWMADVRQLPDGSLEQTLEVLDDEAAKGIDSGSIRFTSPEIGDYIDGLGRDFGTVIRHMALTPTPRNPQQGPFQPVVQFSLSDRIEEEPMPPVRTAAEAMQFAEDEEPKKEGGNKAEAEETVVADAVEESGAEAPENPDMPKGSDSLGPTLEAIVAHLAQQGIALPSDWKNDDDGMGHLLTALKTKEAADQAAEAEKTADQEAEPEPMKEDIPPAAMQFSEEANKRIRDLEGRLAAEKRGKLKARIAKAPAGVRKYLEAKLGAVQFSEDGTPEPQFSTLEVLEMVKTALPKSMQFSEDELEEEEPAAGTIGDDSDEDPDKAAEEQLKAIGFIK